MPHRKRWLPAPLRSLGMRIAVPAGFFALVSVALLSYILIREQREQVLAEVVHGSENISEAVLLSLDQDMKINERNGVKELIEALGKHAGIENIRIFNKAGEIAYSSRPEEVGQTVDKKTEACVYCHTGAGKPTITELNAQNRTRLYKDADGNRLLATIHVIKNRESCAGVDCHDPVAKQKVLGVLDVAVSLEPAQARLAAATRHAIWISLAAVALITAALILLIRQSVRKPLNTMVQATKRIIQEGSLGNNRLGVAVGSVREIDILTSSFNDMVQSLSSSKERLEEWAETLEEKVKAEAEQLREARFQIVQAEKLSSVGLVAAGIAHELNSPLMAIITFAHLVKSTLPEDSQAQDDLRMIEREANRCAAIIRQLLDYSRKQQQEPEAHPCRIEMTVKGALELLKIETQNAGVKITLDIPEDLPAVDGNEVQLMQVLVNLMLNAVHAMPNGGELTVRADVVERKVFARYDLPPHPSTNLLRIRVHDTGTGIPKESLSRVFDPFFTTKPVGKGSGLGLSVSLGLVHGYRGTILVESDGASWTEFTVLLPVSKQPALVASA